MADEAQAVAPDQTSDIEAQQEQQLRSARVRAQQRQAEQKALQTAESVLSKLGPEGVVAAVGMRFLREHPVLLGLVLTVLIGLAVTIIGTLFIFLYFTIHPCAVNQLPIPALLKVLNTITHIQCAVQKQ